MDNRHKPTSRAPYGMLKASALLMDHMYLTGIASTLIGTRPRSRYEVASRRSQSPLIPRRSAPDPSKMPENEPYAQTHRVRPPDRIDTNPGCLHIRINHTLNLPPRFHRDSISRYLPVSRKLPVLSEVMVNVRIIYI